MRAGLEAFGIAFAPDDVAPRAHRARNDSEVAFAGSDRALARNPDLVALVNLAIDVVVVAVDRLLRQLERRKRGAQGFQRERQDLPPILGRELLGPPDRRHVVVEGLRSFAQVREIPVGQLPVQTKHFLSRDADEVVAELVADSARAGMQHDPDAVAFVEAQLDEMVAAAERTDLRLPLCPPAGEFLDGFAARREGGPSRAQPQRRLRADAVVRMVAEADWHPVFDRLPDLAQRVRKLVGVQREPGCNHPAADVHPDRGGNDRAHGRNHGADRGSLAGMHVWHRRDMAINEGKRSDVLQLRP